MSSTKPVSPCSSKDFFEWMTRSRKAGALLAFAACSVHAQQRPDAGTLLQQQPAPPAVAPAPARAPTTTAPLDRPAMRGPSFLLKGFRFTGATLITDAELQQSVRGYLGQTVDFPTLQNIAERLAGHYLERGYLARVVVPEQDIKDGVVELRIIEGRRGSLEFDNRGRRLKESRVAGFIDRRLSRGAPLSVARLDEAMAILNEQPGVKVTSALKPGSREGEIGLAIQTDDKPLWSGAAGLNNQGSRSTGLIQGQGSISLANPTGNFDAASLLANVTDGNTYVRADYSLALGNSGLRLGANASRLDYRVTENSFRPLELNGSASTFGMTASYPLARTRTLALNATASQEVKELVDRSIAGETSNRRINVTSLGAAGNVQHQLGDRPMTTGFGAAVSFGDSDQRNAGALATDRITRQANGHFSKFAYNMSNQGALDAQWSYFIALRGQLAGKNLDSSERMNLGGPSGVRAYPSGEATGDEGWLVNFNLRRIINDSLTAAVFYDVGGITLNRATWANWNAGNPRLPNRYTLAGLGASVDWQITPAVALSAVLAVPVGSNPGRDVNNLNADGRGNEARLWVGLSAQF